MGHTQGPSRLLVPTPSCQVPNSQDKATQGAHRAAACRCWAGAGEEQVRDEGQGSTSKGGSTGSHESSFPLLWHALVRDIPASLARVAFPHGLSCGLVAAEGSGRGSGLAPLLAVLLCGQNWKREGAPDPVHLRLPSPQAASHSGLYCRNHS